MSGNNHRKSVRISQSKVSSSSKGLRNIFNAIGRKIFSRVYKNEVEYGQTLSKKRRKNCVLKSVSLLTRPDDDDAFLVHSPYHINFEFSRDDFRGSVANFQKIDVGQSCCEKCSGALRKGDSLSKFSISSDSACDVSSESSCDDAECKYRKTKARVKKKSKSTGDVSKARGRTVENFIRIHKENFQDGVADCESKENLENRLLEWTSEEPPYESLVSEDRRPDVDDSDYDILLTRAGYRVVEPSYENLKLIENFYESPACKKLVIPEAEPPEKTKDLVQPNKTYDEVIESLKLWHMSSRYPEDCDNCFCCGENEFNHRAEGYESLENDFNNDIEEFCC